MKVISKQQPKAFKPVTIEVTFETRDEIRSLFERLNFNTADMQDFKELGIENENDLNVPLFLMLKDLL